jgi:hypothetical protein
MSHLRKFDFIAACAILICSLYAPSHAAPTLDDKDWSPVAAAKPVSTNSDIPADFKSWSLFLICNPAWILESGDQGIEALHKQFLAFGHSIGKKNAAIWFHHDENAGPTVVNTDIDRSSNYCEKYKLLPSASPYVLVTTRYPDLEPEPGSHLVVGLGGLNPNEGARVLSKLADQLLVTKLNQSELKETRVGWRRVFNAFRSAVTATGCYFNKVSFSINTAAMHAEIGHDDKCDR